MHRPSFAFWYCAFLLLITSSGENEDSLENFTNDDEWSDNSTMPYVVNANSMRNLDDETTLMDYNLRENSVKNESETNFVHELDENFNNDDNNIVLYEMCNNTCVQHCCNLIFNNCHEAKMKNFIAYNSNLTLEDLLGQYSYLFIDYSCEENEIPFDIMNNENTMFFDNSYLNLSRHDRFISLISKCFHISRHYFDVCDAMVNQTVNQIKQSRERYLDVIAAVLIASLLCLLMTFIVYSICPELQNMHGYALRSHVASLFVVYTIFLIIEKDLFKETYPACVAESLLYYFFYLAGLLWQNVICFDILQTFGGFRMLRNIKQSKKKMFLMSSFYVWGITSIYIIICTIMEFVPNFVPDNIQPNICTDLNFGFAHDALVAYFDILISVIIICNICFFIFTMLNIVNVTKNTDRFLKDAESKRHTVDKQRFMMYLKLFLLMDINITLKWTLGMILQNIGQEMPFYVPVIIDIMESLQGVIIFIVFVCKKRIMQFLLKRFNCENSYLYGKISTSNSHTATSHTSSTVIEQEISSNRQTNYHIRISSDSVIENTTV